LCPETKVNVAEEAVTEMLWNDIGLSGGPIELNKTAIR
jgi:hypothetical protein